MHRRPSTEHISTTKVIPRHSDIISALHRHKPSPGFDESGKHGLLERSASVGVTYTPQYLDSEATFDVVNTTIFRMEDVTSSKEPIGTCVDHKDSVVVSDKRDTYERIALKRTACLLAPICKTASFNPISVLLCLVCMICEAVAVGLGDALPINYPHNAAPQPQGRQTMVLMPPFDLGFRGQTSDAAFSGSRTGNPYYYNPYWRQENGYFYADGQNVKPGPPMSLTSGYSKNYRIPESSGYRSPYQSLKLPPKQQRKSHDLMQNDPVYTAEEGAHQMGMSKMPPLYGKPPVVYGNSKQTFDRYNRWQPQDTVYAQPNGYPANVYNRPEQQMSTWDRVEPPVHGPNIPWNHGYQFQSTWYDPAQVASTWQQLPYYEMPYQNQQQQQQEEEDSQNSHPVQGYGPVYGHPSNYGEVSEAELAQRLAEYEENARKAGLLQEAGSKTQLAEDLQLPQLSVPEADLAHERGANIKQKDKGIVISGSEAHDELMRSFNRVASAYDGPYGIETFFDEIDLNNDRAIDIEELKKFLQLHEIVAHQ